MVEVTDLMSRWTVTADRRTQQGWQTLAQVGEAVADAHQAGRTWDVMVQGPRDSAYRPLNEAEAERLILSVRDRLYSS